VVEFDAAGDTLAAAFARGRVTVEANHDAQVFRSPARESRQEPGNTTLITTAADPVEQVVTVDE
jgi:hypothetical protein